MKASITTEIYRPVDSVGTGPRNEHTGLIAAAREVLAQGEALLGRISANDYTRTFPLAHGASAGGHLRHCLDHFASLLDGAGSGRVDYDDRGRDPKIENDPEAALEMINRLNRQLLTIGSGTLARAVSVRCKVNYSGPDSPEYSSTLAREFAYVIAHSIHHYALISVLCGMMGVHLGPAFGTAPSTLAHQSAN